MFDGVAYLKRDVQPRGSSPMSRGLLRSCGGRGNIMDFAHADRSVCYRIGRPASIEGGEQKANLTPGTSEVIFERS